MRAEAGSLGISLGITTSGEERLCFAAVVVAAAIAVIAIAVAVTIAVVISVLWRRRHGAVDRARSL